MRSCKLLSAWGLKWDRVGGNEACEVRARSVCPVFRGQDPQWLYSETCHAFAVVLLICLSGRDNHRLGACLGSAVRSSPSHPSIPSQPQLHSFPSSPLHDWSFCHYFLAAGGDPCNSVNPLTTNCLLLPCCLDKQPGGGKSSLGDL